jgi:hypothetical protein
MSESAPRPPHDVRARPHPGGPAGSEPAEIGTAEILTAEIGTAEVRTAKVRTARTKPAEVVLVCRKCAKRAGLSAKAARRLAKAACRSGSAPRRDGGRKVRVVETGCLGPCPKRLLAVATGASLAAGRVALLDPRADPAGTLPDLGPAVPAPISAPLPR